MSSAVTFARMAIVSPWSCISASELNSESAGQQQGDAFAIVGNREGNLQRTRGGDRHELEVDIDLVREEIGDTRIGLVHDEIDVVAWLFAAQDLR